jgi:hypothetical protein
MEMELNLKNLYIISRIYSLSYTWSVDESSNRSDQSIDNYKYNLLIEDNTDNIIMYASLRVYIR